MADELVQVIDTHLGEDIGLLAHPGNRRVAKFAVEARIADATGNLQVFPQQPKITVAKTDYSIRTMPSDPRHDRTIVLNQSKIGRNGRFIISQ